MDLPCRADVASGGCRHGKRSTLSATPYTPLYPAAELGVSTSKPYQSLQLVCKRVKRTSYVGNGWIQSTTLPTQVAG